MEYKILEKELSKGGYLLKQIERKGDIAIYSQEKKGLGKIFAYEVIKIRRHEGFEKGGIKIEAGEIYPSSGRFGFDGFCCASKSRAYDKFNELVEDDELKKELENAPIANINQIIDRRIDEQMDKMIDNIEEAKIKQIKQMNEESNKEAEESKEIKEEIKVKAKQPLDLTDPINVGPMGPIVTKRRGRAPKLKACIECGKLIFTSIFQKHAGRCPDCAAKKI